MALKLMLKNLNHIRDQISSKLHIINGENSIITPWSMTKGNNGKVILPKNMILRHCDLTTNSRNGKNQNTLFSDSTSRRPLILILPWILAKDKHVEKIRQLWLNKDYDVLSVLTTPFDLLLPPIGSKVLAANLLTVISKLNPYYNGIVVHAFSVGVYQLCQTIQMRAQEEYLNVFNSVKGVIIDSVVYSQDFAPGLSRAITINPVFQPIIESIIKTYLRVGYNISLKNYEMAEQELFYTLPKYPGLLLYSKDDFLSSVGKNEELVQNWNKIGNRLQFKCWDQSSHVSHYKHHPKEYEQQLDAFLKSLH